jgi:hypothetical protein
MGVCRAINAQIRRQESRRHTASAQFGGPHILRRTRPTGCNILHGLDFSEKTFIHLPGGGYDADMQNVHDFLVLGEA